MRRARRECRRKTALVTRSSGGIDKEIAEALASRKCNTVLNGFGVAEETEALRAGFAASAV